MNMYIGENIKRLRRAKNITQEKLGEHLNISCPAISKWERGETYPDITLIMPIAHFFGVSTDELLGVDKERDERKIKEYLAEYDALSYLGKEKEKCDLIRKAHKEYPNNFEIMMKHLWMLFYDPYITEYEKFQGIPTHIEEMERLCNRIQDECRNHDIRFHALAILCDIYEYQGKADMVAEIHENLPGYLKTRWLEISEKNTSATKHEPSEKWWPLVRGKIYDIVGDLFYDFRNCADYCKDPPEMRIKQHQKAIDLINLVYEDGDYGFAHEQLAQIYWSIGYRYKEMGNLEKFIENFDIALFHAKKYDERPEVTTHTSFLVRGHRHEKTNVYSGDQWNCVAKYIGYLETENCYSTMCDLPEFAALIAKYKPYAREVK